MGLVGRTALLSHSSPLQMVDPAALAAAVKCSNAPAWTLIVLYAVAFAICSAHTTTKPPPHPYYIATHVQKGWRMVIRLCVNK